MAESEKCAINTSLTVPPHLFETDVTTKITSNQPIIEKRLVALFLLYDAQGVIFCHKDSHSDKETPELK